MNKPIDSLRFMKTIALAAMLCLGGASLSAYNLMPDATSDDDALYNNFTEFNKAWKVYDMNGDVPTGRTFFSCYSRVGSDRKVTVNSVTYSFPSSTTLFQVGQPIAVLEYYGDGNKYLKYVYPISVPEEDDYQLTGDVAKIGSNTGSVTNPPIFINANLMVAVAERDATQAATFEVVSPNIKVTAGGVELQNGYLFLLDEGEAVCKSFDFTLHLTPADKYIAFYAPFGELALANLSLDNGGTGTNADGVAIEDQAAPTEYYDLQGRKVSAPAAGGIYITRSGAKVAKIVKR